jgi:NADH dehydrogenase [ubiquinone] 1 alpha subcomplex assembly factor 7
MKTHFSKFPVSVYDFMNYALYDEHNGYYMKKTPMGDKNADFITAPELSTIFGEVIAFWILNRIFEHSEQINILELGPGKGTLAKDILTTIKKLSPAHFANTDYNLLEISPTLKQVQANNLAEFSNIKWLEKITDLSPNKLNIVIANEFFDALPVSQYQKQNNQYFERLIDENNHFILATEPTFIGKNYDEEIVEIYPDLKEILIELKHINAQMLFIDYGNLGTSETLQAVKNHQKVSIFEDITNSDLTTQVDFRQIIKEFDGLAEINISNMADFLLANGILTRAEQLLKNANEQQTQNLNFVLKKLLNEDEMGKIFKALEISFLD